MHVIASLRMRARCRLPSIVAAARGPGFRTSVLNESKTPTELCIGGSLRVSTCTVLRNCVLHLSLYTCSFQLCLCPFQVASSPSLLCISMRILAHIFLTMSDEFKMVADPCIGDALRSLTRTDVRSGHVKRMIWIRAFMLVEPLVGDT